MKYKYLHTASVGLLCVFLFVLFVSGDAPADRLAPALTPQHLDVVLKSLPPTPVPTPEATPVPTPESTPEPTPVTHLVTFVGDCTLGAQGGSMSAGRFMGVVGEDYGHPFREVRDIFAQDDLTVINLEGVFTTYGGSADKEFVFKSDPRYAACLTRGSVEAVSVANNHSKDYGTRGYEETLQTLDSIGVLAATFTDPAVFTFDNGFKLGIIAGYYPKGTILQEQYDDCIAQGADAVVASIHMGPEHVYRPSGSQKNIARQCIDMGCLAVVMHHPHVLQPMEFYNDRPIFYSLGNFAFGGNAYPRDLDSAIVQLPIVQHPDGSVTLEDPVIIPCAISGERRNNYQPVPYSRNHPGYTRVMKKLGREDLVPPAPRKYSPIPQNIEIEVLPL